VWGPPPLGWQLWVRTDSAAGSSGWGVSTLSRDAAVPANSRRHTGLVVVGVVTAASVLVAIVVGLQESGSPTPVAHGGGPTPAATTQQPATPDPTTSPPATPATTGAAPAAPGTALALLATIPVKGRAPRTGYARGLFGSGWIDTDRNGCDTRNDMLRRDLRDLTVKTDTHGCVVLAGTLSDPYTRQAIRFVRGAADEVDIDHLVALSDAWQKGAQSWPAAKRIAFANDPMNLQATDFSANRQKGDADAASWLPPNKSYRCTYVARQVGVKAKYRLWVTAAERAAIARVLSGCPTAVAPRGGLPTLSPVGRVTTQATPAPTRTTSGTVGGLDPRYGTCTEAKAHGLGPYYLGRDPEYSWYVDRDHDGIVCE
jgi:Protein of unknown function (DUF1524)/Excalibur calcium-binding domain